MGLLLLVVTSASVQDRDGARTLLDRLKMAMPSLSLLWADGGYAGNLVDWADRVAHITVEIVRKPLGSKMFQVLPRRWVVERTFARIVNAADSTTTTSDCRRPARP
jgi:transposase